MSLQFLHEKCTWMTKMVNINNDIMGNAQKSIVDNWVPDCTCTDNQLFAIAERCFSSMVAKALFKMGTSGSSPFRTAIDNSSL